MKAISYLTMLMICSMFLFQSCGDNTPSEEEVFLKKISGINWMISKADIDGKDVTNSFPGLSVVFNDNKTIAVTNAIPPMWKASNTFSLKATGSSFEMSRDDGLKITASQTSDTKLILKFQYNAAALGGRVSSVDGEFTFELIAS